MNFVRNPDTVFRQIKRNTITPAGSALSTSFSRADHGAQDSDAITGALRQGSPATDQRAIEERERGGGGRRRLQDRHLRDVPGKDTAMVQAEGRGLDVAFTEGVASMLEGFRIRYVTTGEGMPVVMLHGPGGLILTKVHGALARHHRVIAFELPGFGRSLANSASQSVKDLARTMTQATQALGIERYALIGASFGGRVALWQADPVAATGGSLSTDRPHFRVAGRVLRCPPQRRTRPMLPRRRP